MSGRKCESVAERMSESACEHHDNLTLYGLYTSLACGTAKQLSLSRTTALMSTSFSPSFFGNALDKGIGRWLNVETVCCGRHRAGSRISLKTLRVPDIFMGVVERA